MTGAAGQQCHRRVKRRGLPTQGKERDSRGKPCGKTTRIYRQKEEEGRSGRKDGVAQPAQATGESGPASPWNQQGRPPADPDVDGVSWRPEDNRKGGEQRQGLAGGGGPGMHE